MPLALSALSGTAQSPRPLPPMTARRSVFTGEALHRTVSYIPALHQVAAEIGRSIPEFALWFFISDPTVKCALYLYSAAYTSLLIYERKPIGKREMRRELLLYALERNE